MSALLRCFYCYGEIDPNGDFYRHVTGWEKPGRGLNSQSGSSLVLREHVRGEVACVECVTKLKNGVHLKQETLPIEGVAAGSLPFTRPAAAPTYNQGGSHGTA